MLFSLNFQRRYLIHKILDILKLFTNTAIQSWKLLLNVVACLFIFLMMTKEYLFYLEKHISLFNVYFDIKYLYALAIFGIPSLEDDTIRAVNSAIQIVRHFNKINLNFSVGISIIKHLFLIFHFPPFLASLFFQILNDFDERR